MYLGNVKIGPISDTHDNAAALAAAMTTLQARGAECVLHAGDVTSADTLALLEGWHAMVSLGNNDVDPAGLADTAHRCGIELADAWEGTLGGLRVAAIHGHNHAHLAGAIRGGRYDLVVTEHSHRLRDERVGRTRVINPGALYRAARYTCALYDTATDTLEVLEVPKLRPGGRP